MTQGMSIADVEELENRLMALAGRRVFMEYTKANGQRTERTVKRESFSVISPALTEKLLASSSPRSLTTFTP